MKIKNILFTILCLTLVFFLVSCKGSNSNQYLNKFENIVFENKEFIYDGNTHSIYVSNVPEFATVRYEGNEQKEIGDYIVVAIIEADNYEKYTISAKMSIIAPKYHFENILFDDQEIVYDGDIHSLYLTGELPEGAKVTYRDVNNNSNKNEYREIGEYYIEAKIECEFYETLYLYATLKIMNLPIITIDDSKEEFIINNDLKYNDFLNALKKHNFKCYVENGTRQEYPDGSIEYNITSSHTIAVTENMYYIYNDYIIEGEYIYDTMVFAEVVNNQVLISEIKVSDDSIVYYKIPADAFYETFGGYYIQAPFAHLNETNNGGFESKEVPAYYTWFSDYEIKDNKFNLLINNFIFHPEFTNSEVISFDYSNIGNIEINIPKQYKCDYDNLDFYNIYNFTLNGIEYLYYDNNWTANIDLSYYDIVTIENKEIVILASIYDKKVKSLSYPYYVYNKNYTGYKFNVYFNEDLIYQDKYANLGSLEYNETYKAVSKFEHNGGIINYYGTWDDIK